jgi:hypothetical protein
MNKCVPDAECNLWALAQEYLLVGYHIDCIMLQSRGIQYSLLGRAVQQRYAALCRFLVKNGACIATWNGFGQPVLALEDAVKHKDVWAIVNLLDAGLSPTDMCASGRTVLQENDNIELLVFLLQFWAPGASVLRQAMLTEYHASKAVRDTNRRDRYNAHLLVYLALGICDHTLSWLEQGDRDSTVTLALMKMAHIGVPNAPRFLWNAKSSKMHRVLHDERWRLFMRRVFEIAVPLAPLDMPALVTQKIVENDLVFAHIVPLHVTWNAIVGIKNAHRRKL